MTTFIIENISFYLALAVGIIICFYFSRKIAKRSGLYFIAVASKLLMLIAFLLIATGVFSWRINQTANLELNLDTWLISLDISLAHFIFTLPIAIVSYSLLARIFQWIGQGISNTYKFIISALKIEKDLDKLADDIGGCLVIFTNQFFALVIIFVWAIFYDFTIPTLSLIATYWISKFLFVENAYLQTIVIGTFDNFLGWNYPTIYKFTIIVEHWQVAFQTLVGKKEIATILSFLGLVSSGFLGFAALIDAIEKIGKHGKNLR